MQSNRIIKITALFLLSAAANTTSAQAGRQTDRDGPSEISQRYADHRNTVEPLKKTIERHNEFWETVFEPAMEKQRNSGDPKQMFEIPQSVRLELTDLMRQTQSVARSALQKSISYSRFKRNDSQCRAWVDVMQYYVTGLGALADEMSKPETSSGAFANMAMGQLTTAIYGVSTVHPAVLPCFLEQGTYVQPIMPAIRDKYEEIHGVPPPGFKRK